MRSDGSGKTTHWDGLSERDRAYLKLLETFKLEGCPICRLSSESVQIYLRMILREGVIDVDVRQALRDARGLCNAHAWDLLASQDELGTAIIYQDMVNSVLRILKPAVAGAGHPSALRRIGQFLRLSKSPPAELAARLRDRKRCPACNVYLEAEGRWAFMLLEFAPKQQFMEAYVASDGLCIDHLAGTLDRANAKTFQQLVAHQTRHMETGHAHLTEVIRKHDYRFREEPKGEEVGSVERAVMRLARLRGAR